MDYKYVISYDQVNIYALNGLLKTSIAKKGYDRVFDLKKRIDTLIKYSTLPYPPITIIPESRLVVHEGDVTALVYANINYRLSGGYLHPIVEIYLPFLLHASSEIKTLVLAHEFLHYMYLSLRYVSSDYLVNPLIYTSDLTGRMFLEDLYQVNPEKIFSNKRFISRLNKLNDILDKSKIGYTIKKRWIDRGLPSKTISADEFRVKLSMNMWTNMYFPEEVLKKARVLLGEREKGL